MTTEVSTEALESFKISLDSDDGEGGFHTKNPPRQPFQRETIHHDRSSVNIKCSLLDVAHGKWSPDSNSYATLIVFEFRFEPGKPSRRITSSTITVQFRGESEDDDHPGVADLSLDGSYSLVPSTQEETITSGIDGNINISVLSSGQISLDKKHEKVVNRQTSDATYVSGSSCMIGVDWEPNNAVEWKLRENETLKTGVPAYLRAGVLLKRETRAKFKCTVDIDTKVDTMSQIGRWFGGKPEDDPVLFDPSFKATNRLMEYDTENLSGVNMAVLGDVSFTTVLDGTIKHATVS